MHQDLLTRDSVNVPQPSWVSVGCGFVIIIPAEQSSVIILLISLK